VQDCRARVVANGTSNRHTDVTCTVTWTADGASHTADVGVAERNLYPGQTVDLRVSGDQAREDSPAWVGPAVGGFGVALIAIGAIVLVRQRRRA